MKIKVVSPRGLKNHLSAIRAEKNQLSGYASQEVGYAAEDVGMASLQAAAKITRRKRTHTFKVSVKNLGSAAVDRVVALTAPLGFTEAQLAAAGYTVAGIIRTGQVVPGATVGTNDVVAAGLRPELPIELFNNFVLHNPIRVVGMTISANNTKSFETDLQVVQLSPFSKQESQTIDLSDYFRPDNLTGKKIEADLVNDGADFSMDNQTLIRMFIPAGADLTITFRIAGIDNAAARFATKAEAVPVSEKTALGAMGSAGTTSSAVGQVAKLLKG